jgi:hypothetical protein
MKPTALESLTESIDEFSLIEHHVDGALGTGPSTVEFQEVLLSLASILRRKELAYRVEYRRPDQPVFRLRSDQDFGEDVRDLTLNFVEPGRRLELRMDNPGEKVVEGLYQELRILADTGSDNQEEAVREPNLNLLVTRTFQAELYAEYQRWKRYDSPFLVALAYLKQDQDDWEPVGRAFKHVSQSRDMIGYLEEGRVAAFFPTLYDAKPVKDKLSEQLSSRYEPEELDLSFFEVPDDYDDWNSLKKRVFSPIYLTET